MGRFEATTVPIRPRPADPGWADPWGHRVSVAARDPHDDTNRWHRRAAWLVPAVVMGVLGGLGLTRPGLWTDELATWGMMGTPWSQMWPVLRWVDAVLAPYYVLMRAWSEVAGTSDLALRLPSLAAMVAAAALIGSLGCRLAGPRVGLFAGLVFAALPSSTRFAQEARPYALTAFVAVVATYLLVLAWDRPTFARFAAYSGAVALLGLLHIVTVLLVIAHGWVTVAWHRQTLVKWAVAAVYGVLPLLPLVWLGRQQSSQVGYIPKVGLQSAGSYAAVVLGAVGVTVAVAVLGLFSLPLRYPASLYTAWVVLPTAALVVVSLVFPLFLPRYLIFTLPGWALLAGTALGRLRAPGAVVGLACVAALGVSAQLAVRKTDGHDEATREVAQIIATQVQPGDAAVYAAGEPRGGWTTRDLVAHYMPADRRPADPLLVRPPRTDGQLLAGECPDVPRCLGNPTRIWVIRLGRYDEPVTGLGAAKEQVLRANYRVEQVWHPRNLTLALLVRDRSPT
jgi:mannosyltransferase